MPAATEIWQEGIRVTPLRLYDRGEVRRDVLEMLVTNVRHPHDFRGDLAAMIGSAHVGQRRMLALAGEFGWDTTLAAIEAVLDGAERQARAVIATWKDGVYHGEAFLDDDGHRYTDIHIRATVTKRGSDLIVDLSDSHEQVVGLRQLVVSQHAVGGGCGARLSDRSAHAEERWRVPPAHVIAKPGTVVWANEGAPVTLCTNHCSQEIMQAIILALAPACPDRAMAGWGRRFRIAIQGRDPRTEKPFIWHMFQARPGGGASPVGDGWPGGRRVAGGRRHQVRQPGGHRGAVPAVLPRGTSSVQVPAGTASIEAGQDACWRWWRRSRNRRRAIPPATA